MPPSLASPLPSIPSSYVCGENWYPSCGFKMTLSRRREHSTCCSHLRRSPHDVTALGHKKYDNTYNISNFPRKLLDAVISRVVTCPRRRSILPRRCCHGKSEASRQCPETTCSAGSTSAAHDRESGSQSEMHITATDSTYPIIFHDNPCQDVVHSL
jgi:hypothetical protein